MEQKSNEKGLERTIELMKLLENLDIKTDFSMEDLAFVQSHNSNLLILLVQENFPNIYNFLKRINIFERYIVLKIYQFIDLEKKYSEEGYKNRANIELANNDVTTQIFNELEPIEEHLELHPESVSFLKPIINEKDEIVFKSSLENLGSYLEDFFKNNDPLYDLDENSIIESESK